MEISSPQRSSTCRVRNCQHLRMYTIAKFNSFCTGCKSQCSELDKGEALNSLCNPPPSLSLSPLSLSLSLSLFLSLSLLPRSLYLSISLPPSVSLICTFNGSIKPATLIVFLRPISETPVTQELGKKTTKTTECPQLNCIYRRGYSK